MAELAMLAENLRVEGAIENKIVTILSFFSYFFYFSFLLYEMRRHDHCHLENMLTGG